MTQPTQDPTPRPVGYILAISAAVCWGVSGTFAQFLFQERSINPEWLVTVRMLVAGCMLVGFSASRRDGRVFEVWKSRADAVSILIFGVFGMLAVQYTFFAAIKESNAATATVLQYLGPVFITLYAAVRARRRPHAIETMAVFLSVAGTYFLVTHGNPRALVISPQAFFRGLLSAVALAVYSIQPVQLLKRFDASVVVGWGMVVGGLVFSFVHAPWSVPGQWDVPTVLSVAFVILFGTLAAFYAYLSAVKLIGPTKTSLLACAEPLSAAALSVLWLDVSFGFFDWLGTALVLATIGVLSFQPRSNDELKNN